MDELELSISLCIKKYLICPVMLLLSLSGQLLKTLVRLICRMADVMKVKQKKYLSINSSLTKNSRKYSLIGIHSIILKVNARRYFPIAVFAFDDSIVN